MNKILIGLNAVLVVAVAFLFFKVYSSPGTNEVVAEAEETVVTETKKDTLVEETSGPATAGNTPTGKIAFVNIGKFNEKSLEVGDMINDVKRRRNHIESTLQTAMEKYQAAIQDFQTSERAGILSEIEMKGKAKNIMGLENEIKNKELQMDNLSAELGERNYDLQVKLKNFLQEWNQGRYDYILTYSDEVPTMLLANASLEISDEIITEMNNRYKESKAAKKPKK